VSSVLMLLWVLLLSWMNEMGAVVSCGESSAAVLARCFVSVTLKWHTTPFSCPLLHCQQTAAALYDGVQVLTPGLQRQRALLACDASAAVRQTAAPPVALTREAVPGRLMLTRGEPHHGQAARGMQQSARTQGVLLFDLSTAL
jgi:hypothetical protein